MLEKILKLWKSFLKFLLGLAEPIKKPKNKNKDEKK